MRIGYANAQGINNIEWWYLLEQEELKRLGHNVYEFNLRYKQPEREEIKKLDFIHFHYCHVANQFKRLGKPYAISPHTNDLFPDNGKMLLKASSHKNCKFVTYQSFYHKRFYEEIGVKKPLVYLPMCVRTELFKRKYPLGERIIAGGRLVPRKGLDKIMHMSNLHVFGDGPLRYELQNMNRNNHFVGHLDGEELKRFYEGAWLYLFPSEITPDGNRDGLAGTLKEAMLMELQVIASPNTANAELENVTIYSDWKNISNCISDMPREPNKKGRKEILNTYSPKSCIERLLKGIEEYGG